MLFRCNQQNEKRTKSSVDSTGEQCFLPSLPCQRPYMGMVSKMFLLLLLLLLLLVLNTHTQFSSLPGHSSLIRAFEALLWARFISIGASNESRLEPNTKLHMPDAVNETHAAEITESIIRSLKLNYLVIIVRRVFIYAVLAIKNSIQT